jgi:uncharacterized protein involved in exopolysaccharide biosynthesis
MNSPGPVTTNVSSRQATMREFLAVLFRRRGLIVGLFVVVSLTVVVLTLTTPTTYTSSGRVLVYRGERQSALSSNRMFYGEWESELGSEVARAHSAPVIERTREVLRERAQKAGRPEPKFDASAVDVEVMGRSDVLGVAYTDRDPVVAHDICDALITAYLDIRQTTQIGKPESFFEAEMQTLDTQIRQRLNERESIAARTGVTNTADQSREWGNQLSMMEQKRTETGADLAEALSALASMSELQKNPDIDIPTIDQRYTNESALVALKQKIVEQQTRIANLRERYRDDAAEVQNALSTLETLQALLRKEVDARIEIARSRIETFRARAAVQDRQITELRERLSQIPDNQRRFDELDAEVKTLRQRYDDYARARDMARINANTSQGLNVVLLNPAGPGVALNKRDYVRLALAPGFSLVVGIGLAFFIDGLDFTVRTRAQAEEYLEIPVLASLSERRSRRG